MRDGGPYLRKKGLKYIIEQKVEGKTKYIMTLPPIVEIIKAFKKDALDVKESQDTVEDSTKVPQKGAQSLLPELQKDTKNKTLTPEEIQHLYELTK